MSDLDPFGTSTRIGLQFPGKGMEYTNLTVVSVEIQQSTDVAGNPKTWDDGKPKMEVVVGLQVPEDQIKGKYDFDQEEWEEVEDDDFVRYIFCSGGMFTAARKAHKAAKTRNFVVGGTVKSLKHTMTHKPSQVGWKGAKVYEMVYAPPAPEVEEDPFSV